MSKAVLPFAFVDVSIRPLLLAEAMLLVVVPPSNICLTQITFPSAVSMFSTIEEVTIIQVSIRPGEHAFSCLLAETVVAQVLVSADEPLEALAMALIL